MIAYHENLLIGVIVAKSCHILWNRCFNKNPAGQSCVVSEFRIFVVMENLDIFRKALALEPLDVEEAMQVYSTAPLAELMLVADTIRREQVSDPQVVTWQIDRNVNITNVCISGCKFCNFHCIIP